MKQMIRVGQGYFGFEYFHLLLWLHSSHSRKPNLLLVGGMLPLRDNNGLVLC